MLSCPKTLDMAILAGNSTMACAARTVTNVLEAGCQTPQTIEAAAALWTRSGKLFGVTSAPQIQMAYVADPAGNVANRGRPRTQMARPLTVDAKTGGR